MSHNSKQWHYVLNVMKFLLSQLPNPNEFTRSRHLLLSDFRAHGAPGKLDHVPEAKHSSPVPPEPHLLRAQMGAGVFNSEAPELKEPFRVCQRDISVRLEAAAFKADGQTIEQLYATEDECNFKQCAQIRFRKLR